MKDLDAALQELGMLSSVTRYKLDYLQDMESRNERRKVEVGGVVLDPKKPVEIKEYKSHDKASYEDTIASSSPLALPLLPVPRVQSELDFFPGLRAPAPAPSRSSDLENEARQRRLRMLPSSHICSFLSGSSTVRCTVRNRTITVPGAGSSRHSFPLISSLPGVLMTSGNRQRSCRGRVRFREPLKGGARQHNDIYPLDEELTARLSQIKLTLPGGPSTETEVKSSEDKIENQRGADCMETQPSLWSGIKRLEISHST